MGGSQGGSQGHSGGKVRDALIPLCWIFSFALSWKFNYAYLLQGTYGKDTLRPVTILQVLNAQQPHPDADFSIDDVEITQVSHLSCRVLDIASNQPHLLVQFELILRRINR